MAKPPTYFSTIKCRVWRSIVLSLPKQPQKQHNWAVLLLSFLLELDFSSQRARGRESRMSFALCPHYWQSGVGSHKELERDPRWEPLGVRKQMPQLEMRSRLLGLLVKLRHRTANRAWFRLELLQPFRWDQQPHPNESSKGDKAWGSLGSAILLQFLRFEVVLYSSCSYIVSSVGFRCGHWWKEGS